MVNSGWRISRALPALMFGMGIAGAAHAFSITSVTLTPEGTITSQDEVHVEVGITTPSLGAFLFQPTQVARFGNDYVIRVFADDGRLLPALDFVEESIPLGMLAPGEYTYSIHLTPAYEVNWGLREFMGSFTVVPDTDGDGIGDTADNCTAVTNPLQIDSNGDGIGNACDADIAPVVNNCQVDFGDLAVLKTAFFSMPGDSNWNPDADFNGDNEVNFGDLGRMKEAFFGAPGPSGVPNVCDADTPCGPSGLICRTDTEVCVARTPVGPAIVYECEPVPQGCDQDRSCACAGVALCQDPFNVCTETGANQLQCECPLCQ